MDINLAIRDSIKASEAVGEVLRSGVELLVRTGIVWEMVGYGGDRQFRFEQINLVQEKDYGFSFEPLAIDKRFKEHHGFMHLVLPSTEVRM